MSFMFNFILLVIMRIVDIVALTRVTFKPYQRIFLWKQKKIEMTTFNYDSYISIEACYPPGGR